MAEPQTMPAWANAWVMIIHAGTTLLGLLYVILKLLFLERKFNGHIKKEHGESD